MLKWARAAGRVYSSGTDVDICDITSQVKSTRHPPPTLLQSHLTIPAFPTNYFEIIDIFSNQQSCNNRHPASTTKLQQSSSTSTDTSPHLQRTPQWSKVARLSRFFALSFPPSHYFMSPTATRPPSSTSPIFQNQFRH